MGPSDLRKVLFSSFVAGALLIDKEIGFSKLCNYMLNFENKYDIGFEEPDGDFDKLKIITMMDDNSIKLIKDYDDLYQVGNNGMTVYDYLYSLTNYEIRQYFGIEEREDVNVYNPSSIKKKSNILTRIKRTKVYA